MAKSSFYGESRMQAFDLKPFHGLDISSNGKVRILTSLDEVPHTEEQRNYLDFQYHLKTGKSPRGLEIDTLYESLHNSSQNHEDCDYQSYTNLGLEIYSLIESLCSKDLTVISDILIEGSNQSISSPHIQIDKMNQYARQDKFQNQIEICAKKLLPLVLTGTLVHEMGHNISMAHNFAGSEDKEKLLTHQ